MMRRLLTVVAVVAPLVSVLPAARASADTVCLPITIDGQQVCEDITPVQQAVAEVESTVIAVADTLLGEVASVEQAVVDLVGQTPAGPWYNGVSWCDGVVAEPNGVVVSIGNFVRQPDGTRLCSGYELRIEANVGVGTIPVHVPQVCLTTTGTCVGGIDTSAPMPGLSYNVCLRSYWELMKSNGDSWGRNYQSGGPGDGGCLPAV